MKKFKKITLFILAVIFTVTLTSCDKQNKNVPYEGISDTAYVSNGTYSVSQKEVYNVLRTKGYDYFNQKINMFLIKDVYNSINYKDSSDKQKIDEMIISAIFSTTDAKAINGLEQKAKDTQLQKFIDEIFTQFGVKLTKSDLNFQIIDNKFDGEFSDKIVDLYKYSLATEKYARSILVNEVKEKKINDEKNPVYISEDNIIAKYKTMQNYGVKKAIIISFPSKRAADLAINAVNASNANFANGINDTNKVDYLLALYNFQYAYEEKLTLANYESSKQTNFVNNADHTISNPLNSVYTNIFDEFSDGQYTVTPKNIENKYVMFMKIGEEFTYPTEYAKLSASEKTAIDTLIINDLIDERLSASYINSKMNELLETAKLEIYDPYIEYLYKNSNTDYKLTKNFDNSNIFKLTINSREEKLSVKDFYDYLNNIYGVDIAVEHLINKLLVNNDALVAKLTETEIKSFEDTYKADIKSFKSGSQKDMGQENYLLSTYGYSTKEDVIKYSLKANALKAYASKDLGKIYDSNQQFLENNTIFNVFSEFTKNYYQNYFSLNIQHILITIDPDNDGNPNDPNKFMDTLTDSQKSEFKSNITSLAKAIVAEADSITAPTLTALQYIVDAYNLGKPIYSIDSTGNTTWDQFKWNYNISLVAEDLNTIDNTSASTYVTTFSQRVKELYNTLKNSSFDTEEGYLEHVGNTSLELDDLAYTNYGYHILNVSDITNNNSAKFTFTDDTKLASDDLYKRYEHIGVTVDKKDIDKDNDDIIIYTNGYSSNDYPSVNQLFIYYYEKQSSDVNSFKSSIESAISKVFDLYLARFNESTFQDYRLHKKLGTLTFTDNNLSAKYNEYLAIQERAMDNYADTTSDFYNFSGWFNADWNK